MNDLDEMMDNLPIEEWDIDKIIRYQREARMRYEKGGKAQKAKPKVDMSSVMKVLAPKQPGPDFRR